MPRRRIPMRLVGRRDAVDRLLAAVTAVEHAADSLTATTQWAIEREKQRQSDQRDAITRDTEQRRAQARARLAAEVDRRMLDVQNWLQRSSDYAYRSWKSDVWSSRVVLPAELPALVKLATVELTSPGVGGISGTNGAGESGGPGAARSALGPVEVPFALPPLGTNLVITHGPNGLPAANALAQGYVVRALAASIPGSLRVHLLDPSGLGDNVGILTRLPEPLGTGAVRASRDDVAGELRAILEHLHRLHSTILLGDNDSLIDRWQIGQGNDVPCSLVLATGVSTGFTGEDVHQLCAVARGGHRCGASVVAVVDSTRPLPHGVQLDDLLAHAEHVHVEDERTARWESAPAAVRPVHRLRLPSPPGHRQHRFLVEHLGPAAREGVTRPVHIAETLAVQPIGAQSSLTTVAAPVGRRADGQPLDLAVGDSEGVAIGGVLVGPSGSGKTTLLHTFIQGLVHRYPPSELELYLLDMKDGVEFAEYAPRPGRPALPHLRALGIETDPSFALGVLTHLTTVDRQRKHLFKQTSMRHGVEIKNIAEYRTVTGEVLPRILLIADEFQLMLAGATEDAAWSALDILAKQGRSQGIHMILATQSLASVGLGRGMQKSAVFDQLELRVGLRCKLDELSRLLERTVRSPLGSGRRGSGVLNQSGGDPDADVVFQAGIVDADDRAHLRDVVTRRYSPSPAIRVSRGSAGVDLTDVAPALSGTTEPMLYVGAPVAVEPPLVGVPARAGDGRGLLLTSRDEIQGVGAITAMVAALALQPACSDARFVMVDLLPDGVPSQWMVRRLVGWLGDRVTTVTEATLSTLADVASPGPTFVGVVGLQYCDAEVPYFSESAQPHPFTWLCGHGPAQQVFPLIWLDVADRMRKLGPDAGRLHLRADAGPDIIATTSFFERRPPFTAPRGRMWFHDLAGTTEPVLVDPFRFAGDLPPLPTRPSKEIDDQLAYAADGAAPTTAGRSGLPRHRVPARIVPPQR